MNAWLKAAVAAVILALLIPMLYAATTEKARMVIVERQGTNITASVVEITAPAKKDIEQIRQDYDYYKNFFESSNASYSSEEAFHKIQQYTTKVNVTSLPNANISFYYRTPTGYDQVPGCVNLVASDVEQVAGIINPLDPTATKGPYYSATCAIPISQPPFNGTCKDILVHFVPAQGELGAFDGTESVCDTTPGTLNLFASELAAILSPTNPACFTGFIVLGLLFASMFFSGKSPLSLLDLTTPRLPSPKGLAASGQVLGPFGYTEMKKATTTKLTAAVAALAPYAAKMGIAGMSSVSAAALFLGRKYGAEKEAALVARKGEKIDKWGKQEHEAFGKMINAIEEKAKASGDKRALLDAKVLQDWYIGKIQYQRLEVLTAHPDVTKKGVIIDKTQKFIRLTVGRLPMLGPLVSGAHDSIIRSGRVMGRFTKAITAEPVRAAMSERRMKELEEAAKKSASAKALYEWLTAGTAAKLSIGGFYPIKDRAAQLYKTLHDEAYHDMMKYALKQLYKKYGMKFDVDIEEMVKMGLAEGRVDILARSGFKHSAELAKIEDEIRNILSKTHFNSQQKYEMIIGLLETHGVHLDPSLRAASQKLDEVERKEAEGHVKLVTLYEYLASEHKIQDARAALDEKERHPDRFSFSMGHNRMGQHEYWENMVLRKMIYDAEKGYLNKGHIEDALNGTLLHLRNRMNGLREGDTQQIVSLLTEEGRAKFAEYHGFDPKLNPGKVTVEQLLTLMYGGEEIIKRYKLSKDEMGAHVDAEGKAYWWGADKELPPDPRWWKVDMKRNWEPTKGAGLMGDLAIANWVEQRFTKSHVPPYNAEIERKLNSSDKYRDVKTWTPEMVKMRTADAKRMWMTHLLEEDVRSFMNSTFAQNAYGQTNETVQFYSKIMAGFLAAMFRDKGVPEHDAKIRMLENLDLTKKQDRKVLGELLQVHSAEFSEFTNRKVTYDMMSKSKSAMIMLHEGGIAPYIKGMTLSDYDRPLGGYIAIKDNNGRYKRFDPDNVRISFEGRADLEQAFGQVSRVKDKSAWEGFLREAKEWAGNDFGRQKVLNGVLWRYANTTDDWKGFWAESAITMKPKREVGSLSPLTWRMFAKEEMPGVEKFQSARNFMMGIGDMVSRASLAAAGPALEASYAITPFSEYYRQQSWHLAQTIKGFDKKDWDAVLGDVASPMEREKLRKTYENVAMGHFPYHQIWDWAIDRNPWRTSTSYGGYQTWGSFFHFGPRNPYPMRQHYRAILGRGEYVAWELQNWPMRVARKAAIPFQDIVRGAQQAMQGYPSRWDQSFSPMKPYDYTPVRIRDFVSALNPISAFFSSYSSDKQDDKTRNWLSNLDPFKNPMVARDLAGSRIGTGMKQAPQDIFFARKGVYASARTGEANPGCSYYDYRFVLQLDNCMAEYLAYRSGDQTAYFQQNKYVREQALKTTVKREVAAEALALRREHELRGFGLLQNPIYGWFAPPLFLWHLPFLPQISPRELVTGTAQRIRFGGSKAQFSQMAKDSAERFYYTAQRGMSSWKSWKIVYCPSCQTAGYRGAACKSCKAPLY